MDSKIMTRRSLFKAIACAVAFVGMVALAQAEDTKLDPTGTWSWTTPGRNGNPGRTSKLTIKKSDAGLTGTLTTPGRGDNPPNKTEISNIKIEGDQISFKTTREVNGDTLTSTYTGTLTADSIKGKIAVTGGSQERPPRNWEAKHAASSE
jgi:hypothetical protein